MDDIARRTNHTRRSAIDRQHQRRGYPKPKQGMEKWKAKYAFHFPTPSTAARYLQNSLRYTNYPTGTKDWAGQELVTS
jgi:hypothetical protein